MDPAWLEVGWDLWKDVHPDRDFFMGLPTDNLASMKAIEAKYVDGLAMGRALFSRLKAPDGAHLR